jgi:type IV secretion system protein VirD4
MDNYSRYSDYTYWASEEEIKSSLFKIKLSDKKTCSGGIPLYSDSEAVYVEDTDTHSLVIGSTGSKKTRLIGMPSLWTYARAGESFIATDPKAELYEKTLPLLKKQRYKIFVLNLRNPQQSNCWNPLLIPYRLYKSGQKDKAVELITDISNCIVKEEDQKDPYWQNSASDLLAGLITVLFECANEKEINFKSLRALRNQAFQIVGFDDKPFIMDKYLSKLDKNSFIYSMLSGTAGVCDTTRGCIASVFDQAMRPFFSQNDLINLLSTSEMDMKKIGKEKNAIFLIIPDENTLYHRLISIFIKQCYSELIIEAQKLPLKRLPVRVNFLLDEFASLPPINDFPAMITAARSRNIRFNILLQSLNQLEKRYGFEAGTIKGNCENWVFLHSRELTLLNELVELAGKKYNNEPLISVQMLQKLDKKKGEAFIMHKRIDHYIGNLLDIDQFPQILSEEEQAKYPENTRKVKSIFDFENYCLKILPSKQDSFCIEPLGKKGKGKK